MAKKAMTDFEIEQEAQGMGAVYAAEPKVRIKIQKDPLNEHDEIVPVCLNGYLFQIKRGETVDVPQTVAGVLERAGYI
ncbi:hypothetical protein CE91St46_15590 [Eubacteriales bacterium]|nr:hypothetical protein [Faecalicatena sp. BF-R-105]GKH50448.1 hypothetical protein CE91St46_15590 [Eubacteriales bacterium]GKH63170.1 hypothetical protein CE91St47_16390 [Eubacteriales bacterium]